MPARTKSLNSKGSNKNMHGAEQEQNEVHIKHRKSNENLEDKLDVYKASIKFDDVLKDKTAAANPSN